MRCSSPYRYCSNVPQHIAQHLLHVLDPRRASSVLGRRLHVSKSAFWCRTCLFIIQVFRVSGGLKGRYLLPFVCGKGFQALYLRQKTRANKQGWCNAMGICCDDSRPRACVHNVFVNLRNAPPTFPRCVPLISQYWYEWNCAVVPVP